MKIKGGSNEMLEKETRQEQVITFKEGIPGFEELTQFIMLEDEDGVFCYLQAMEDEHVVFPIINPYLLKKDYAPNINESYFEKLGGGKSEEFTLFAIATIKDNIQESTLNLQGPLLIHIEKRIGIQAIVEDKVYQTRHKIADLMEERGA